MARLVRATGPGDAARCGWLTGTAVRWADVDALTALERGGPDGGNGGDPLGLEGLLAPIDAPEVWAAGVTYERSRQARVEETEVADVYSLVYEADRPELFLKDAGGRRTVGPGAAIGVRSDGHWSVPEPELALVLGRGRAILGATIGNDVTARDIEGTNPLYLPQAKVFAGACAIGPAILPRDEWPASFAIHCRIRDPDGSIVWEDETSTARMRRSFDELVEWLLRENPVPPGSILLTGTGLVPPDGVALRPGQSVEVEIPPIGRLVNPVEAAADLLAKERSTTDG
ncbi:MAG TPA: fumarylacetoacetate hydrolase family protein [Gaiellaceae bacterium]